MIRNITLDRNDAYQQVFNGLDAQLTAVSLGIFNIVFGGYFSYALVMDDIKIIEHRGTLISRLWVYHDLMLSTLTPVLSVPFVLRVVVGPLNEVWMMWVVLTVQFVLLHCALLYNEIFLVRILLGLWFKSAFALEENFFLQFFMTLNFYSSSLYVFGLWLSGGYTTQYYYFMLGLDLTLPWIKPLFNGGHFLAAAFLIAQVMYMVIVVYRAMSRIKNKMADKKFKHFLWNIMKMMALMLCFMLASRYRNMFPANDWESQPVLFIFLNFGTPFGVGVVLPATRYLEQVRKYF